MAEDLYITLRQMARALLPEGLIELPSGEALDRVWVTFPYFQEEPFQIRCSFLFETELAIGLPGLDAVQIVLAGAGLDTVIQLEFDVEPRPTVKLLEVPVAIRFSRDLLKPALRVPGAGDAPARIVEDTDTPRVDITLAQITFAVDFDGNISVQTSIGIDLPLCLIGDTGVAIEARQIRLYFGLEEPPPGKPAGWRGVHIPDAHLYLPGELGHYVGSLGLRDAYIGNGGFTGRIEDTWDPPLTASLLGISLGLRHVEIALVQNTFTNCQIQARLNVPFFNGPADVLIGISADGSFILSLDRRDAPDGLVTLNVPDVLRMTLSSIGLVQERGVWLVKLSGSITPLIAGLDWPTFELQELAIDSQGHVKLEGGWINLPTSYSLTFYGFTITISRIGFGNSEDGGHWIGFSGGLRLVEGLEAGVSVEGLKITWYDEPDRQPTVTLNGVAVRLEIKDTLRFEGAVAYRELQSPEGIDRRFDGQLALHILALDFEIDGRIVIGSHDGPSGSYQYLALYVAAELPFGIPLLSTGLGLYGMAGLFALNMEPDKEAAQAWYSTGREDWFHRPEPGVAVLTKWRNRLKSFALGAGVTIGTLTDNGYTFAGKFLLVFIFPGPIIMLEGKANLLKERARLDAEDPLFRALTVLDFRIGTMVMGLDVHYKYEADGQLLAIRGGAEAFFDFHDGSIWHIYLGEREPRERRIRADIFNRLLQANAYFMIDAHHFTMGAWAGFDKSWTYGPLALTVQAWVELNAELSYKPTQFHGEFGLHGGIGLHVFGIGFDVALDARLGVDTPRPFHISGHLDVALNLPMPLPSFSASIPLEWGPVLERPPIPLPLKEISIEHFKSTISWPLSRQGAAPLLMPNYDDGAGFLRQEAIPVYDERTAPPDYAPVVPLDCRPHLTFGRAVNDDAGIGVNAHLAEPEWERIGDPASNQGPMRARYGLKQVALDRWDSQSRIWRTEAYRGGTPPSGAIDAQALFGSWAPLPQLPTGAGDDMGHTKLWLWSQNPFDYTRRTGGAWEEWFTSRYPDYPCLPALEDRVVCVDFERFNPGPLPNEWEHPDVPGLIFHQGNPKGQIVITELDAPVEDFYRAICFKARYQSQISFNAAQQDEIHITVALPAETRAVSLLFLSEQVAASAQESDGTVIRGRFNPEASRMQLSGVNLTRFFFQASSSSACIAQICLTLGPESNRVAEQAEKMTHLQEEVSRWQQVGAVLRSHSQYRLRVVTTTDVVGEGELAPYANSFTQSEYAFFRTEGPPALANLSLPSGIPETLLDDATLLDQESRWVGIDRRLSERRVLKSELNDLTRYVRQTIPPTVPASGELPALTRPVYRAYDTGVEFNENYVKLLYRIEQRDLGLYLFDQNNRPVRDVEGRIVAADNRWGRSETRELARSDRRWEALLRHSSCHLDLPERPRSSALLSLTNGVLEPDSLYEARLIPLLLHDDFARYGAVASVSDPAGVLQGWQVYDEGTQEGPSLWEIRSQGEPASFFLTQTSSLWGGPRDLFDPVKLGTLLVCKKLSDLPDSHPTHPGQWTDYRLSLYLRRGEGQMIGVVFRFRDEGHYYRWTLNNLNRHQLVLVVKDRHTMLAQGDAVVRDKEDVLLTIEAVENHLRGYLDGQPLFDVTDASLGSGAIGLYCWNNPQARFTDIRVEDFRRDTPVAYRFQFITSRFVNFFHHLHSFQDETWRLAPTSHPGLTELLSRGVELTSALTEDEARAYDSLAEILLGSSAKALSEVQVSRLDLDGAGPLLLLRSPEPIDWKRTSLSLQRAAEASPRPEIPHEVKLTDVSFASSPDGEESITLLARENTNLTGYRIEYHRFPGLLEAEDERGRPPLETRLLFRDHFAEGSLAGWRFVDQSSKNGPARWEISDGGLIQRSVIGDELRDTPLLLGTQAIASLTTWKNLIIEVRLREPARGTAGLVFCRKDDLNYYEFILGQGRWRLLKRLAGSALILWEREVEQRPGALRRLSIEVLDSTLRAFIDDVPLFVFNDKDIASGALALSCAGNDDAQFYDVRVYPVELAFKKWLLDESFDALAYRRWIFPELPGAGVGQSQWHMDYGSLRQVGPDRSGAADETEGLALAGEVRWTDMRVTVHVNWQGSNGGIGVLCRAADNLNHYRFVLTPSMLEARLICRFDGTDTILWQGALTMTRAEHHLLMLDCLDQRITAYLDGIEIISVQDSRIFNGKVGGYTVGDPRAKFKEVRISSPCWTQYYQFGVEAAIPAGTKINVSTAISRETAPPDANTIQRRTMSSDGEPVWPKLDPRGTTLRICSRDSTTGHSRWFGGLFLPVPGVKIIRKRDGTGLALTLDERALGSGYYRLMLTYRRDNDPAGGPVFSQAGDRSNEVVVLDIPASTVVDV